MRKNGLYHPVSLYVIRAALTFSGVELGRIRQTSVDPVELTAEYYAEIKNMPVFMRGQSCGVIAAELQQMFSFDIEILTCGRDHEIKSNKTRFWITLRTQAAAPFVTTEEAEAERE